MNSAQQRLFFAFGLAITSDWQLPLPQLPRSHFASLRLTDIGEALFTSLVPSELRQHDPKRSQFVIMPDGSRYFRFQCRFDFHISPDAGTVSAVSLDGKPDAAFQTYMLSHLCSHVLLAMGRETIHGACVVLQGSGVALLGDSARGKSTLAAAFLEDGHPLLSDDFLALRQSDGKYMAYPAIPRIKLYERVSKKLFTGDRQGTPMNQDHCPKFNFPLEDLVREPVPMRGFYALASPKAVVGLKGVVIERLTEREAYLALTENTFNVRIQTPARLESQFKWATELAKKIPVKRLSYPRVLSILPDVIAAVKQDLAAQAESDVNALATTLPSRIP